MFSIIHLNSPTKPTTPSLIFHTTTPMSTDPPNHLISPCQQPLHLFMPFRSIHLSRSHLFEVVTMERVFYIQVSFCYPCIMPCCYVAVLPCCCVAMLLSYHVILLCCRFVIFFMLPMQTAFALVITHKTLCT